MGGVELLGFVFELRDFVAELAHLRLDRRGIFTLCFLGADFLAGAFAVALQLLELRLGRAALLIAGEDFIHGGNQRGITRRETLFHEVGLFAEEADIEHGAGKVGSAAAKGNAPERSGRKVARDIGAADRFDTGLRNPPTFLNSFQPLFDFLASQPSEAFAISPAVDARRHLARTFAPELPLILKQYAFPTYRRMVGDQWMHWHEYLELIVPVSGAGLFQVGAQTAAFHPGDLLVVDNLKLHGVAQLSGPHRSLVILFPVETVAAAETSADHAFLAPLCARPEDVPPLMSHTAAAAPEVHAAVLGLAEAYFGAGPSIDRFLAAKLHLLTILYHLRRHFGQRPDYSDELRQRQQRVSRLTKVFAHLATHFAEPLTQPAVAEMAGMSPSHFRDFFKQTTGRTFVDYLRDLRLAHAARLLRESPESIADIAAATGFSDQSYLHRCFKARYGCAPFDYRRQIRGG